MGELLTDLARWVVDVVHSFGYVGVFVLVLSGSLFLPIPTELTLPLFGFLVGQGRLSFVPVPLTGTAARVSASLIFYALGFRISGERVRRLIKRFERTTLLSTSDSFVGLAVLAAFILVMLWLLWRRWKAQP